jgi:hypothetical protein
MLKGKGKKSKDNREKEVKEVKYCNVKWKCGGRGMQKDT